MTVEVHWARRRALELAVIAGALLGLWLAVLSPVLPQEAYYWTYAKHLDLSYFDHPPMVAWLIAAGTAAFGDGRLGLRIGTLACAVGTTLVGLEWLRRLGGQRWARIAWAVLAFGIPLFAMGHFHASPDAPLVFFWAAAVLALWRARDSGRAADWILAGAAAGAALLSKYTAAFLAVGGVALLLLDPAMRRQLARPGPWLALIASIVVFSPVLVWNQRHDWASFRYQSADRAEQFALTYRWLPQLVGEQIGLLSPIVACLVPAALLWCWRRARAGDVRGLWCIAFGAPLPAFMLAASLGSQVKINWLAPAYVALVIAVLLWAEATLFVERRPRVVAAAKALAAFFIAGCVVAPFALEAWPYESLGNNMWSGFPEIARKSREIARSVDREDGKDGNVFFFTMNHRESAQLAYELAATVGEADLLHRTLAQNVMGGVGRGFDFWEPASSHVGEDAVFVLLRPDRRNDQPMLVGKFFERLELAERLTVKRLGIPVQIAEIYVGRRYRGART